MKKLLFQPDLSFPKSSRYGSSFFVTLKRFLFLQDLRSIVSRTSRCYVVDARAYLLCCPGSVFLHTVKREVLGAKSILKGHFESCVRET